MEIQKDGKMERWKDGKMERWKDGKMEKAETVSSFFFHISIIFIPHF